MFFFVWGKISFALTPAIWHIEYDYCGGSFMSDSLCYCGSQKSFAECCEPIIADMGKARTPEELMRARYSAHASGKLQFLVDSVHPDYRKGVSVEELEQWSPHVTWTGLEILSATPGETDNEGYVSFTAHFKVGEVEQEMTEDSFFTKHDGTWMYVDGTVQSEEPYVRESPRVGRNDPCPCGSGKKHKKCCGK